MESTWERRDLPVLDAIVRYFDEEDSAVIPDVKQAQGIPSLPQTGLTGAGNSNVMGGHHQTIGDPNTAVLCARDVNRPGGPAETSREWNVLRCGGSYIYMTNPELAGT